MQLSGLPSLPRPRAQARRYNLKLNLPPPLLPLRNGLEDRSYAVVLSLAGLVAHGYKCFPEPREMRLQATYFCFHRLVRALISLAVVTIRVQALVRQ